MRVDQTSMSVEEGVDRRKSGRSIRKPELFSQEHHDGSLIGNVSAKRKRTATGGLARDDENEDLSEASDSEESDDESTEEEVGDKQRAARKRKSTSKPAIKKPKMSNGGSATLAIRSANIQSKPASKAAKAQKARSRQSQMNEEGLYAEVFGRGQSGENAAADWLEVLQQDSVAAIRDLVNFILKCTGCDLKVESYDIEDVDNVASKVGELLDDFQQTGVVEYPLISKLKQHVGFQAVLVDFIGALVKSLHAAAILYDDPAVFENIQVWVATMSSATFIPCRHTATVISLAMSTALCEIAQALQQSLAMTRAQIESERKKKNVNKGRIKTMEESTKADEKKLAAIDELLKDAFDTVFVHRYRDVNEKLRVECVMALGNWIVLYRKMFLEGQYLRYLGWVLSDTFAQTRGEVIKQLKTLFKNQKNIAALRAFTERFRPRMIEIGERDTDQGVRAEAVELLDKLRDAELLEPNDIDTIGQLIFDTEPRVRKAVSKFFVSNIEDLYKASIEEMDEEQYDAALPKAESGDEYLSPTQSWIKYKCLAQSLTAQDGDERVRDSTDKNHVLENMNSRYMLATESIFPHMEELQNWESLAGYLLFDHSKITADADDPDISLAVQGAYKLGMGEEVALLDVLYYSVKLHLQQIIESQAEKKGKKSKTNKDNVQEKQEAAAQSLTSIIPQLLNKFGSTPDAAAAILRLEHLLNIDLINDLQQGDATTASLLETINNQFMTHSDRNVLTEAKMALHEARKYEQSKEAAETKIQEAWNDAVSSLQTLLRGQNISTRGTLSTNTLNELSNTVSRLASLASIWDCSVGMETKLSQSAAKKSKAKAFHTSLLDLLLDLAKRGTPDEDTTPQFERLEDDICASVMTIISFYFRWKAYTLKTSLTSNSVQYVSSASISDLAMKRSQFVEILAPIMSNRPQLDPIRVQAVNIIPEIFTIFAPLRHAKPTKGPALSDELIEDLSSLIIEVPAELQALIMQTYERMEKSFAKRTRRKIEKGPVVEVREDAAPVDSDDEDDDDDEEEEEVAEIKENKEGKRQTALLIERSLCELASKIVLAVIGRVMDQKVKEALLRNRTRLGRDYAAVIAYLDQEKREGKKGGKSKTIKEAQKPAKNKANVKSAPMVLEDDDIEDDDDDGDLAQEGQFEEDEAEDGEDEPMSDEPQEVIGD